MSETYGTGLLTISIVPKTPEDGRKLTQALQRLTAEDPQPDDDGPPVSIP